MISLSPGTNLRGGGVREGGFSKVQAYFFISFYFSIFDFAAARFMR